MKDASDEQHWDDEINQMIADIMRHGLRDRRVLAAMRAVPRHRFIPESHRGSDVYGDHPLPIGHGQTISQPYIVAYMTHRLDVTPGDRVLEVGTGCGYQAAILAELGAEVFSVERVRALSEYAARALSSCGYDSVHLAVGDGSEGLPEEAPFDGILAACAPAEVPEALRAQLSPQGGRLIMPVGRGAQRLVMVTRHGDEFSREKDIWVRFVPMV